MRAPCSGVGCIVGRHDSQPADLGYDASAYELPPLTMHQHTVEIDHNPEHGLLLLKRRR